LTDVAVDRQTLRLRINHDCIDMNANASRPLTTVAQICIGEHSAIASHVEQPPLAHRTRRPGQPAALATASPWAASVRRALRSL